MTLETAATVDVICCPLCGAAGPKMFLDAPERPLNAAEFGSSRKEISRGVVLRCGECQFGFRKTRSNPAELAEIYGRMDTTVYRAELAAREQTARTHLRIVHRYIHSGHLLDVGCASGIFLQQAADKGWRITGLEPSAELYKEAIERLGGRGVIHPTILEQSHLKPGFDVITLWDVLEHVPVPLAFLVTCCALLNPKGYLFLNVPDLDSLQARLLGVRWPLFLAEHLNYFNRPSLRLCGRKAGLTLVCFGRRSAWFSISYTAYRLSQHRIPLSGLLRKASSPLGRIVAPLRLGETYAVFRRS